MKMKLGLMQQTVGYIQCPRFWRKQHAKFLTYDAHPSLSVYFKVNFWACVQGLLQRKGSPHLYDLYTIFFRWLILNLGW